MNQPIIKLSEADPTHAHLLIKEKKIINSKTAEIFHDMIEKKCGFRVLGSYVYFSYGLTLWVEDNENTEIILKHWPHTSSLLQERTI